MRGRRDGMVDEIEDLVLQGDDFGPFPEPGRIRRARVWGRVDHVDAEPVQDLSEQRRSAARHAQHPRDAAGRCGGDGGVLADCASEQGPPDDPRVIASGPAAIPARSRDVHNSLAG